LKPETKGHLVLAGGIAALFTLAIVGGKACEALVTEPEPDHRHQVSAVNIAATMDECGRTATACCDEFSGCVDDLKRCRDVLLTCEAVMRDVARAADIRLPLPDAGLP
jgi:hypothetical protein